MKYAMYLPNMLEFADSRLLSELASEAEEAGWDGFFIWDALPNSLDPTNVWPACDPWVTLAAVAIRTERIRIGTMITALARRRPWKLANETATLDRLSGGRLTLGVGLGVPESDFEKLGEDPDPHVRAEKLDEGLTILAGLWSGKPFSFSGKHYQVRGTAFLPRPLQLPRIPIWVGAWSRNKAPLRRAAGWDGVFPIHPGWPNEFFEPDDYRQIVSYIAQYRQVDATFDIAATGTLSGDKPDLTADIMDQYAEVGVTWWLQEADSLEGARKRIRAGPPKI